MTSKFSSFDGTTFQSEANSRFPHVSISLGNYRNSPFATGGHPNFVQTEILDYATSTWVQVDDYPFSNTDRYLFHKIVERITYFHESVIISYFGVTELPGAFLVRFSLVFDLSSISPRVLKILNLSNRKILGAPGASCGRFSITYSRLRFLFPFGGQMGFSK